MLLYESAFTYLPFAYFYASSIGFATLFHNPHIQLYQPYIVLIFMVLNTVVYYGHDKQFFIKHMVHRHLWRSCTLGLWGILINSVHVELFKEFHFQSEAENLSISILYVLLILICCYWYENQEAGILVHMLAAFVPLRRTWEVNLYLFVVYLTLAVVLSYQRVKVSWLTNSSGWFAAKPLVNYFCYLRLHDMVVLIGPIQLYIEYYRSQMSEVRAAEDISKLLEEMRTVHHTAMRDAKEESTVV